MYIEIDDEGALKIIGKLTEENIAEVQNHLNEFLYQRNYLILDITDIEQLDMPGIYMLFNFRHKAKKLSKKVSIILNSTSNLNDVINNSGLKEILD